MPNPTLRIRVVEIETTDAAIIERSLSQIFGPALPASLQLPAPTPEIGDPSLEIGDHPLKEESPAADEDREVQPSVTGVARPPKPSRCPFVQVAAAARERTIDFYGICPSCRHFNNDPRHLAECDAGPRLHL